MAKVVVLGADGFIGKHMVRRLAEDPANSVIAFDRFTTKVHGSKHEFDALANVSIVVGNFFNRDDLAAAVTGCDYVFHLVSSTNPAVSIHDPLIDIDTNIRSSVELFLACSELGVKRVIFLSSGGTVYGDVADEVINEDVRPQPTSPYAIGKLTIEHYLRYFKRTHGIDYVVYRVANPYGPGQNIYGKQGVIPIFMEKALHDQPITIYGDGSMVRDYLYIDDLINMIVQSYTAELRHDTYNLGSGSGLSVDQIVDAIEKTIGKQLKKEYAEQPPTFVQKITLDTARFTGEFGKRPMTDIVTGLKATLEYVHHVVD